MKNFISILILIACINGHGFIPNNFIEKKDGWLIDGKIAPNDEHVKSINGFGAQLWIIEDQEFFEKWNIPSDTVKINNVYKAKRGKPVFVIILFGNPGVDEKGKAQIEGSIKIKTAEGKIYGEVQNANIWRDLPAPKKNSLGLSVDYMGIVIEPTDPSGIYRVETTVHDKIKNVKLNLKTHFEVK